MEVQFLENPCSSTSYRNIVKTASHSDLDCLSAQVSDLLLNSPKKVSLRGFI